MRPRPRASTPFAGPCRRAGNAPRPKSPPPRLPVVAEAVVAAVVVAAAGAVADSAAVRAEPASRVAWCCSPLVVRVPCCRRCRRASTTSCFRSAVASTARRPSFTLTTGSISSEAAAGAEHDVRSRRAQRDARRPPYRNARRPAIPRRAPVSAQNASHIERSAVLLLDMGNTFMFGCDRFSDADDFHATYRAAGGRRLEGRQLRDVLRETLARMDTMYVDAAYYDAFPSVRDVVATCASAEALSGSELDLVADVFARHEVGTITPPYVRVLEQLAERWRLGVVSNIWASSGVFRDAFERASIMDLFDVVVFSSDYGCFKPS